MNKEKRTKKTRTMKNTMDDPNCDFTKYYKSYNNTNSMVKGQRNIDNEIETEDERKHTCIYGQMILNNIEHQSMYKGYKCVQQEKKQTVQWNQDLILWEDKQNGSISNQAHKKKSTQINKPQTTKEK